MAFSQGMTELSDLGLNYMYKDDLKLQPFQVTKLNSLMYIPWIVKPFFGFISDSFRIWGYRRKPYLYIFGSIGVLNWILMSFYVNTYWQTFIVLMSSNISEAFCNVIGGKYISLK